MEKLNKVIYSKESKTRVAIQGFGVICFFAAMALLYTATTSNSPAMYFFLPAFFRSQCFYGGLALIRNGNFLNWAELH